MSTVLLERPAEIEDEQVDPKLVSLALSVDWSAREWLIVGSFYVQAFGWSDSIDTIRTLAHLIDYEDRRIAGGGRSGRHRRISMDVDTMVARWVESIVLLATAHDHEARSRADHETDDLLRPLMSAPIAELRRFAVQLTRALRDDQRVPFLIWSGFERVIAPLVKLSPEGEILELREQLANEVAELVEKDLDRAQLVQAIAGALAWRSPIQLEAVKTQLAAGAKPRLRGRESCLFLEVGSALVVL